MKITRDILVILTMLILFGKGIRSESNNLFRDGQVYKYQMLLSVKAGSSDYIDAGSVFKIKASLLVEKNGNSLFMKIQDPSLESSSQKFSTYSSSRSALEPLTSQFIVTLENGKAQSIGIKNSVPTWAANIERGIANIIQIDTLKLSRDFSIAYDVMEKTTIGLCSTEYLLIENSDGKIEVQKFRNHLKCQTITWKVHGHGFSSQHCPSHETQTPYKSSGNGIYFLERDSSGNFFPHKIAFKSNVFVNLFGNGEGAHSQISSSELELEFQNLEDVESLVADEASVEFRDNLDFVFESDNEDSKTEEEDELEYPPPNYFHQVPLVLDDDLEKAIQEKLIVNLREVYLSLDNLELFNYTRKFHAISPTEYLIPLIRKLSYEHLNQTYIQLKTESEDLSDFFLDAVSMSGTGPAVRLILSVASSPATEVTHVSRFMMHLHSYVTNPSLKMLQEFERILDPKRHQEKKLYAMELCFASLLGRGFRNSTGESDIARKWMKTWSDRLKDKEADIHRKTAAVFSIGNTRLEQTPLYLSVILMNSSFPKEVRSAALLSTKKCLISFDGDKDLVYGITVNRVLLNLFLNKTEDAELRNSALETLIIEGGNQFVKENLFQQISLSYGTEVNPQVKSFVWTLLKSLSGTTNPCLLTKASYAKAALQKLGSLDHKLKNSAFYLNDYHERKFHFGHTTTLSVEQDGKSVIPRRVTVEIDTQAAGYSVDYFTIYIRTEGLEKALSNIRKTYTNFPIKRALDSIGVSQRKIPDMHMDIAVSYHGRIVSYISYSKRDLDPILEELKTSGVNGMIEKIKKRAEMSLSRIIGLGMIRTEITNEFGIPVTTSSSLSAAFALDSNLSNARLDKEGSLKFRLSLHGHSSLNNHFVQSRESYTVRADRSLKCHLSQNFSLSFTEGNSLATINAKLITPTSDDPVIIQFHSTASTGITPEIPTDEDEPSMEIISKGHKWRKDRKLGSGYKKPRLFEGLTAQAKYFDCEDLRLRNTGSQDWLTKFYQVENKNLGVNIGRQLNLLRLGTTYLFQSLFLSPQTPTCGLVASYSRDENAPSILESVSANATAKRKEHFKAMKASGIVTIQSKFNYIGKLPLAVESKTVAHYNQTNLENTEIKSMTTILGGQNDQMGLCLDLKSENSPTTDMLDYKGHNEPKYKRRIRVNWGNVTSNKGKRGCNLRGSEIILNEFAERSGEQKYEESASSTTWPYAQCRREREMLVSHVPATDACVNAAFLQTNLKKSRIHIDYNIDSQTRDDWKYPSTIVKELLFPYKVEGDSIEENLSDNENMTSGNITLNFFADEVNPEVDIFYESNAGGRETYKGVDLSALPTFITRPGHSRLSPLLKDYYDLGLYGYCYVTPFVVQTFDNASYSTELNGCPTVLSGDCSVNNKYLIQIYKPSDTGSSLHLKIILEKYTVEIKDLKTFTVNGVRINATNEGYSPENDADFFKVVKYVDRNIFFLSESLSVYVRYSPEDVTVAVGSYHRGIQCGLCGNFDGNAENDFTGPNPEVCALVPKKDMPKAYNSRNSTCAASFNNSCK